MTKQKNTIMMTEKFIMVMLSDIEEGKLKLEPQFDVSEYKCGSESYKVSNGYTLVVFFDCEEFDYIESIISPDGEELDIWIDYDKYKNVIQYRPNHDVSNRIYHINS